MSKTPAGSGWLHKQRLTAAQCQRIRDTRTRDSDITLDQLGKRFGVSGSTIRRVLRGEYEPQEN